MGDGVAPLLWNRGMKMKVLVYGAVFRAKVDEHIMGNTLAVTGVDYSAVSIEKTQKEERLV